MAYRKIINNFTKGELDPRFLAMVDYDGYHKGCRKFQNMVCIPQGGATRRFGTNYSDVIVDRGNADAPITNVEHVRIIDFEYDATEKYSIVIRPDSAVDGGGNPYNIAFDVYHGLMRITDFYPPVNTYTVDDIREFRWALGDDRIILFHNDYIFHQLKRITMNSWNCTTTNLQYYPTYDYTPDDNPAQPYTSSGEVFTSTGTTGTVTFARSAGTSTPFTDNHVGGLIFTQTAGVIRIETVNSNISVTGYTLQDLQMAANNGSEIIITERAWGDGSNTVVLGEARGWPGNGDFFQGRLITGNWKSKPGRGSASQVNQAFNFDDWDSDASSGYSYNTGSGANDVIHDVIGYKSLVTVGFKGPSSSSILLTEPTTPTNIFMNLQGTERGARIDGKVVNNQILYVGYNFETIYSMYYELPDTGYNIMDASALSGHLITEARWADVYNPTDRDGNYYCVVNEDGTIACLLMIAEENIRAWSQLYTNGRVIDVACTGDDGHLLVERKISTDTTVTGNPNYIYTTDKTFTAFTDITADIAAMTATNFFTTDDTYLVVGNQIQFTRLDFTLSTLANADCELEFQYLDADGNWLNFLVTDGTTGMTSNGEISWDYSDVSNWGQNELNGVLRMYWIRIRRTAPGKIDTALTANSAFTSFTYVDTALDSTLLDVELFTDDGDFLVIGHTEPFGDVVVDLDTVASADVMPIFHYLDHDGNWTNFAPTDGTMGFRSNGTISWDETLLTNWTNSQAVNGNPNKYWIRIQRNQPVLGTPPIENKITLNIATPPVLQELYNNSAPRIYREELDFDSLMDCEVAATADATGNVTGLDALAGQKCFVYSNDFPIGSHVVSSTGTLTLGAENANYNVVVGIPFTPLIVPMPVDAVLNTGHNTYHQQHIIEAYIDYYESAGITFNGQPVVDEGQGLFMGAKTVELKTQFWEAPVHRGWDPRQEVEISQSYPAPMTILGIGLTVEIS